MNDFNKTLVQDEGLYAIYKCEDGFRNCYYQLETKFVTQFDYLKEAKKAGVTLKQMYRELLLNL